MKYFEFKDINLNPDGTIGDAYSETKKKILKNMGVNLKIASNIEPPNLVPSGVFVIDLANFGGFTDHGGTMIHGVKSSGKSTLALLHIKEYQYKYPNKKILYLAIERGCFNKEWAIDLGVNLDDVIVIDDAVGAEQYIDIMEELIKTNSLSLIVVDSVPELLPADELSKDTDKELRLGSNARMNQLLVNKYLLATTYLRQVSNVFSEKNQSGFIAHIPSILFINQRREKMNVSFPCAQLPGGNRLLHFPTVVMELKGSEKGEEAGFIVKNTHSFNMGGANNRNKSTGVLIDSGVYDVTTSLKHSRGIKGLVDDFATVVKQSLRYGLSEGAGTSYRCGVFKDTRFRSHKEIEQAIFEDRNAYWLLRASIIGKARLETGMELVPPDNLLQHCSKEQILECFDNIGIDAERKPKIVKDKKSIDNLP